MGRVIGLLVVFGVGLFAVFSLGGPRASDLECPDPPVLAAATHPVALSCADTVSYEGTTYYIDCVEIHASRVGESFLTDGGDTYFVGAREIEALLVQTPSFCKAATVGRTSPSPSRIRSVAPKPGF